jgi:hypothetical protein
MDRARCRTDIPVIKQFCGQESGRTMSLLSQARLLLKNQDTDELRQGNWHRIRTVKRIARGIANGSSGDGSIPV